jgi:uncharacterized repeat protein (TIGR03803 family)
LFTVFAALSVLNLTARTQTFAASESTLWNFGNGNDGGAPQAGLVTDTDGNLYGTTILGGVFGGGTVFELTPPSIVGGQWSESVLWNFNGEDGFEPYAGLVIDANGNLYGTTIGGGAFASENDPFAGTVFELTLPSTNGGKWTESVLWSFGDGTDGFSPAAGLIMDGGGNLYGTTAAGGAFSAGTVFEVSPPSAIGGSWTESVLWSFGSGADSSEPFAGLIVDKSGNLYGTTSAGGAYGESATTHGDGTAFELTPPATIAGDWTEAVLWSFGNGKDGATPEAGLILDASGNLYGTTSKGGSYGASSGGYGTAFELSPPATIDGNWTESVLWSFGNGSDGAAPEAGLITDLSGNLYGTTSKGGSYDISQGGYGTTFELSPPATTDGNWTESILWSFGLGDDGVQPQANLSMDAKGNLYSTSLVGGTFGAGTVFEIAPAPTLPPTTLTASAKLLNFGNLHEPGTSKPKKITLTNKGKVAAMISRVTATAPFKIAGGKDTCSDQTIAAKKKKTCSFYVEFAPTVSDGAYGSSSHTVGVIYNGTSPAIALEGTDIPKR